MKQIKITKQTIAKTIILICIAIIAGLLVYMGRTDGLSFTFGTKEKNHLRIAVVNQDQGGKLNDQSHNFGEDFTRMLTADKKQEASWQVMSRAQAESRYEDDSLEAVIYIPRDFSDSILQLNSFNPEQAKITYKVKKSVKREQSLEMAEQVGEYVNSLNQRTIRLYFTSVINNLDTAKGQMNNIVNDETDTYNALTTSIYNPAQQSIQSLDSIVSMSDGMKNSNRSFEDSTLNFRNSTAGLLQNNANTLSDQSESILQYQESQSRLARHNAQVAGNSAKDQYLKDEELFTGLYNSQTAWFYAFNHQESFPKNEDEKDPYFLALSRNIEEYNDKIMSYQTRAEQASKKLQDVKTSLETTRDQVAQNYFNDKKVDTSALGEDEEAIKKAVDEAIDKDSARQALAKQVVHSLSNPSELPVDYTNQVDATLASISVNANDYSPLFAKMKEMGALTDEQISGYYAKINLLANYASVKGATTGSIPSYSVVQVENDQLPATESRVISLDHVFPEMKNQENEEDKENKEGNKYVATPIRISNIRVQGAQNAAVTPGVDSISEPTAVQLQLQLTPSYGLNTVEFDVEIGSEKIPMQYSFYYDNNRENTSLVKEDLSAILAQLSRIDTAAATVKNLYGSPGASYDIDVAAPADDSVAKMYGNLTPALVQGRLQQEDVDQYRQSGIDLYTKLSKEINRVQQISEDLPQIKDEELPSEYFSKNLAELNDWYQAATADLNNQYQKWKENEPSLVEVTSASPEGNLEDNKVYTSDDTVNRLHDTISNLASSTNRTADTITANGTAIGSMDSQFSSLSDQAKRIQGEVSNVHQQTETLIKDQAQNIKDANTFNNNFKEVLSNARSNGTDNQSVLNFLSNPVASEKINKQSILSTTPIWVYLCLILLLTNLATGLAVRLLGSKAKRHPEEDEDSFK